MSSMRHVITTVTLSWLLIASTVAAREKASPLPDASQVRTISITFDHPQLDDVEFAATPDDWRAIRASLLPARRDPQPADWEWVGTVNIVKRDGQPFRVELYTPSKAPGAFAAGPAYKQRVYYRGGKTTELLKALNAAYDRSKNLDP